MLSWRLSNTLEADFCVEALEEALSKGRPEIFNTDQGSQFTSEAFTGLLERHGVRISMDGKGSYNNLFIERLWRTVNGQRNRTRSELRTEPVDHWRTPRRYREHFTGGQLHLLACEPQ